MCPAWRHRVSKPYLRSGMAVSDGSDAAPGRDNARVHARPVEAAHDARMLDLDAAVDHDIEPRIGGDGSCFVVADAELHPQHLGADGHCVARDRHHLTGLAKTIDDANWLGYRGEAWEAFFAEDFIVIRVDRDDAIAMILHVLGGEIARPVPLRRQPDAGDGSLLSQDSAQPDDIVDDRHGSAGISERRSWRGGRQSAPPAASRV